MKDSNAWKAIAWRNGIFPKTEPRFIEKFQSLQKRSAQIAPGLEEEINRFDFVFIRANSWLMNLFENIPENAPEELFSELLNAQNVRIERIVSFDQSSPDGFWYDQAENEWILLLKGSATLGFDDGSSIDLQPGDYLNIEAGRRHRVEKTDPNRRTVWLAVFHKTS